MPADQAQAQMYPRIAHFQTFFAAASMRLDVANLIGMRASFHGSSPTAHLRTAGGPALADLHTAQKKAGGARALRKSRRVGSAVREAHERLSVTVTLSHYCGTPPY